MPNRAKSPAANGAGFTLIELLVVIAIIAILAAILFPVFAQAREKGRAASCLSNCKQMGMAAMMYFQDFDETYAPSAVWGPPNFDATTRYWWPELINAYAKNTGVFVCPSDEPGGWAQNSPNAQVRLCSYTMNAIGQGGFFWPSPKSLTQSGQSIGSRGGTGFTGSNFGVAQVQDPAGTIYLVESKGGNGLQPELWQDSHTDYVGSNSVRVAKRHQEGFNIVWADGHAKWVKFGSTKGWQWTVQAD